MTWKIYRQGVSAAVSSSIYIESFPSTVYCHVRLNQSASGGYYTGATIGGSINGTSFEEIYTFPANTTTSAKIYTDQIVNISGYKYISVWSKTASYNYSSAAYFVMSVMPYNQLPFTL